jgi:hypothetical protein
MPAFLNLPDVAPRSFIKAFPLGRSCNGFTVSSPMHGDLPQLPA